MRVRSVGRCWFVSGNRAVLVQIPGHNDVRTRVDEMRARGGANETWRQFSTIGIGGGKKDGEISNCAISITCWREGASAQ